MLSARCASLRTSTIVLLSACCARCAWAGDLNPPAGPIAPTMKSLDQVEPRKPLSDATTPGGGTAVYRITEPGSYYMTRSITVGSGLHGIEVFASNVTIDLRGFSISGLANSAVGIRNDVNAANVTVMNGTVQSMGFHGIALSGGRARIESVDVIGNGFTGMVIGARSTVNNCFAADNGNSGIATGERSTVTNSTAIASGRYGFEIGHRSTISDCIADENELRGISALNSCTVTRCQATYNLAVGIYTPSYCTVIDCTASFNGDDGIVLGSHSSAQRCDSFGNDGDGIQGGSDCRIVGNRCGLNGQAITDGAGIHLAANATDSLVADNHVTDNDRGVRVETSGNLILRNTAAGNSVAFEIVANNKVGPVVTAPNSAAINGSSGGAGVGSTDPSANIVH